MIEFAVILMLLKSITQPFQLILQILLSCLSFIRRAVVVH